MINLVQAAKKSALDLQSVMEYRLTEVPLTLISFEWDNEKGAEIETS